MLFNFLHQNPLHCNTKLIKVLKKKKRKQWLAIIAHQYDSSVLREKHTWEHGSYKTTGDYIKSSIQSKHGTNEETAASE